MPVWNHGPWTEITRTGGHRAPSQDGSHGTEANAAVAEIRVEAVSTRGAAVLCSGEPKSATDHPAGLGLQRPGRVAFITTIGPIPVIAPLPEIPVHVV